MFLPSFPGDNIFFFLSDSLGAFSPLLFLSDPPSLPPYVFQCSPSPSTAVHFSLFQSMRFAGGKRKEGRGARERFVFFLCSQHDETRPGRHAAFSPPLCLFPPCSRELLVRRGFGDSLTTCKQRMLKRTAVALLVRHTRRHTDITCGKDTPPAWMDSVVPL